MKNKRGKCSHNYVMSKPTVNPNADGCEESKFSSKRND